MKEAMREPPAAERTAADRTLLSSLLFFPRPTERPNDQQFLKHTLTSFLCCVHSFSQQIRVQAPKFLKLHTLKKSSTSSSSQRVELSKVTSKPQRPMKVDEA